jgi:general stress protein 26
MASQFPRASNTHSLTDAYDKLWEIIKDCRFGMLTTVEADGSLRARPMTTVQKEFSGTLWFFSPAESDATRAIEENEHVCVAYANTDKADFVSLTGSASFVMDKSVKEKLWNPMVQAWFPQGPSSPDVILIKVDANRGEYWDSKSNRLVQLFSLAAAYVKGATPDMGEHRKLNL